jgi:hypothetical protein
VFFVPTFDKSFGFDGAKGRVSWSDGMSILGPLLNVEIGIPPQVANALTKQGAPLPQSVVGTALLDTGAAGCVIDEDAAQKLALQPVGAVRVAGVGAPEIRPSYAVRLYFPELMNNWFEPEVVTSSDHLLGKQGILALIGRDFLRHTVLVYNGKLGTITLAW